MQHVVFAAIALICLLTVGMAPAAAGMEETHLALEGSQLSAQQASELEARLKTDPADFAARCKLLGYYFGRQHIDPQAVQARTPHVLWFIHNRPDDEFSATPFASVDPSQPDAFAQAKAAWSEQVDAHPKDPAVLGNAATFSLRADPLAAEKLLNRAVAADPTNPTWFERLAHLYKLQSSNASPAARKDLAAKALANLEQASSLTHDEDRQFYLLGDMANSALKAADLKNADEYAHQYLAAAAAHQTDWNYGNAIHDANTTLGMIALHNGDLASAKAHLLDAGKTPGSPQLDSFGPDLSLAQALLEKGERATVLEYLNLIKTFWKMGQDRLTQWTNDINAGRTPTLDRFR